MRRGSRLRENDGVARVASFDRLRMSGVAAFPGTTGLRMRRGSRLRGNDGVARVASFDRLRMSGNVLLRPRLTFQGEVPAFAGTTGWLLRVSPPS